MAKNDNKGKPARLNAQSSSSSAETPFYLAPNDVPAIPWGADTLAQRSSSSSGYGPNTTDYVKSSSTAPETKTETQAPASPKFKEPEPEKKPGRMSHGKPVWTVPYTKPDSVDKSDTGDRLARMQETIAAANATPDIAKQSQPESDRFVRDPHRSLLQAIAGWDDVPYGKKWTHYIQHGFTGMHGGALQELLSLANTERGNSYGGSSGLSDSRRYAADMRYQANKENGVMKQYDALLKSYESGHFSSNEIESLERFKDAKQKLVNQWVGLGRNPDELRDASPNAGGFSQTVKRHTEFTRNRMNWLGELMEQVELATQSDPNWLNSNEAQALFDKLGELVMQGMSQSVGVTSDAEKVRNQVAIMPEQDRAAFDRFTMNIFNAQRMAEVEALSNSGDRDAKAFLESVNKTFEKATKKGGMFQTFDPKTGERYLSQEGWHILLALIEAGNKFALNHNWNPLDLGTAMTSYKDMNAMYKEYVLQNSNADRKAVWNMGVRSMNALRKIYDDSIAAYGLTMGHQSRTSMPDPNFGEYLGQWQKTQLVPKVIANASPAIATPPEVTEDPDLAANRGGAGGNAKTTPEKKIEQPDTPTSKDLVWNPNTLSYIRFDPKTGKVLK